MSLSLSCHLVISSDGLFVLYECIKEIFIKRFNMEDDGIPKSKIGRIIYNDRHVEKTSLSDILCLSIYDSKECEEFYLNDCITSYSSELTLEDDLIVHLEVSVYIKKILEGKVRYSLYNKKVEIDGELGAFQSLGNVPLDIKFNIHGC